MTKLARECVLVSASEYTKKMVGKAVAVNPFQNPKIRQAKKERSDMEIVNANKGILVEQAKCDDESDHKARVTGKQPGCGENTMGRDC